MRGDWVEMRGGRVEMRGDWVEIRGNHVRGLTPCVWRAAA